MLMAEEELIQKSRAGDLQAFSQLITNYQHKVYTIAFRFMGNEADALDLAQEAMIKLYKNIHKFKGECSFNTWIYHITANTCRDELRKRQRHKVVSLQETFEGEKAMGKEPASERGIPHLELEKTEVQANLQKILNGLPEEQRLIIVLRELQGLSYEEIGAIMECSLGTVKSRLSRARNNLKNLLIQEQMLFREEIATAK